MPHKRNPIGCEQIVGLARLLRGNADGGAREHRALARARHLALVGRARHPARQLHRARSHAAPLHAHRRRAWSSIPSGCARTSSARAASCSRARCCSSWRAAASRASRPTSGCSATRCASFHEQRDFKALLLADADVTAVLPPAEIERAFDLDEQLQHVDDIFDRVFAGRRRPSRRLGSPGGACMRARVFVTLKPSVFDPQGTTVAEALHSLGYGAVEDVRQGKYFELELDAADGRRGAAARGRSGRQAARQSGHRELSHRGRPRRRR